MPEASSIARRQLLALPEGGDLPDRYEFEVELNLNFPNTRLRRAYIALQAWKKAIYSDPLKTTENWVGANVCSYTGVFCAKALDDPELEVVAGIDLNHADIAGYLPVELGLLTDIALFHINSNRFCGIIPKSFSRLTLLHEFDVSNNRFVGSFPEVVLHIPNLKYLDLRFNNFEGKLPPELFNKKLDALFLNDNRFTSTIPDTLGNSPVSVLVVANNDLEGCIPNSIGKMVNTLNEIILSNNKFAGCLPPEIGYLSKVTLFDISSNTFSGILSKTFKGLEKLEEVDISHNMLTGFVPESICTLPNLVNFTFSYNFFNGETQECVPSSRKNAVFDDISNCLPERPQQKSAKECQVVVSKPVDCGKAKCGGGQGPSKPSQPPVEKPKTPKPEQPKQQPPPQPKQQPPKPSPMYLYDRPLFLLEIASAFRFLGEKGCLSWKVDCSEYHAIEW